MVVMKEILAEYGKEFNTWLSSDQCNELLSLLRASFVANISSRDDMLQQQKDIMFAIEMFDSSFQLSEDARQFYLD